MPGEERLKPELIVAALRGVDPKTELTTQALEEHLDGPEAWRILDLLDRLGTDPAKRAVESYLMKNPQKRESLERLRQARGSVEGVP